MSQGGVQPIQRTVDQKSLSQWGAKLSDAFNLVLKGKINCLIPTTVTLRASQTTTTLTDERIGASSHLTFQPLTAHAATALANLWVSNQLAGSCTINHSSSANADQNFRVSILG